MVAKVPPELRQTKTGLQQERGKAKKLNIDRDINEQGGEQATSQREQGDKDTIVTEVGPPPEIVIVKI